jgi:hypothetical protein
MPDDIRVDTDVFFVRRPDEWGPAGPPDPVPNPATDIVVGGFAELADHFGA